MKTINPLAIELNQLFLQAIEDELLVTAFCLDLARTAIGWELADSPEYGQPGFVMARKAVTEKFDKLPPFRTSELNEAFPIKF